MMALPPRPQFGLRSTVVRAGIIACAAAVASATTSLGAMSFTQPSGWTRPTSPEASTPLTLATYQHWDVFSRPDGPNVPDVASFNGVSAANALDVFALDPNGNHDTSVTSTGNLYAGQTPIHMRVTVPNFAVAGAEKTRFHLQIRTRGTELFDDDGNEPHALNFSRLFIDGTPLSSLPSFSYRELYRLKSTTGTNSAQVESSIDFELPGNASLYTIEWTTPRGSCSQDEIAVDTFVVLPEPASAMLLTITTFSLATRRRRPASHTEVGHGA